MKIRHYLRMALWASAVPIVAAVAAQGPTQKPDPLDEPFKGVTSSGSVTPGLFPIRSTGVSTEPVRKGAIAFLASLTPEQRAKTTFPVDDLEWRKWNNVHRYTRQGVSFKEMSEEQREQAFGLLKAGLSAKGLEKSRNIMRLNETIAEMTKRFEEYGEGLYNLTVMGEPSATDPWGWQLDGHHLIINYFVLRDQVVMTPAFMGSEPIRAEAANTPVRSCSRTSRKGPGVHERAERGSAETGDAPIGEDRQQLAGAGVPRQSGDRLCRGGVSGLSAAQKSSCSTSSPSTSATCQQATRRCGCRRSRSISTRPICLDRWHLVRRRLLLPDPQPGHPDRVRSPDSGGAARSKGAGPDSCALGRQDSERERLRQGLLRQHSPRTAAAGPTFQP